MINELLSTLCCLLKAMRTWSDVMPPRYYEYKEKHLVDDQKNCSINELACSRMRTSSRYRKLNIIKHFVSKRIKNCIV